MVTEFRGMAPLNGPFFTIVSCLLTVTLHVVDVRLTCLIHITYLLTYLFRANVLRPLDLAPLTDFTCYRAEDKWHKLC